MLRKEINPNFYLECKLCGDFKSKRGSNMKHVWGTDCLEFCLMGFHSRKLIRKQTIHFGYISTREDKNNILDI